MKQCPTCASINQDLDNNCGICGGSLSGIASENLEDIEVSKQKRDDQTGRKIKVHVKGLAILATGLAVIVVGLYLLITSGFIGVFLLLAGVTITVSILGIDGSVTAVLGKRRSIEGKRSQRRWESEHRRELEKRETGEAD